MSIWIYDSGASTEEIRRGIDAAKAVFSEAGVTAQDAHTRHPEVWATAEAKALDACCDGWLSIPESAHLELEG